MRFSADYDSEEEEYPVDNASHAGSPRPSVIGEYSSESEDDIDDGYSDTSSHFSPRGNLEAWVTAY